MVKLEINILFLISFKQIVFGVKFCDNMTPLETIFTLSSVTYARKQEMFYRILIGKPLNDGQEKHLSYVFHSTSIDPVRFAKVETAFVVTSRPECGPDANVDTCSTLDKLFGLVFVIGTSVNYTNQVYKTYRFDNFTGRSIPPLVKETDQGLLPSYIKLEGKIMGQFWPINATDTVKYLHSTYDERSFTIFHVVYKNGSPVIYSCVLTTTSPVPICAVQPMNCKIKGFFHLQTDVMVVNDSKTEVSIHAIQDGGSQGVDTVLDFSEISKFNDSSISLNEIYGCDSPLSTRQTPSYSSISTKVFTPIERSEQSSLLWLLIFLIVFGMILIFVIGVIIYLIRERILIKNKRSRFSSHYSSDE